MTKTQAQALAESAFWKGMTHEQIARFQINEPLLCMPFGVFQEAVEKALGRPVFTHEFGLNLDGLKAELNGERGAPSMDEILNMLPADKRQILVVV